MDDAGRPDPQQRDMMYCHQCENEWYRDEHGLQCPQCDSDFTQILESPHDDHTAAPNSSNLDGERLHGEDFFQQDHPGLARLFQRHPPSGVILSATYSSRPDQNSQSAYNNFSQLINSMVPPLLRQANFPTAHVDGQTHDGEEEAPNHLPATFTGEFLPGPGRRIHFTSNYIFNPQEADDPTLNANFQELRQLFEQVTAHDGPLALGGILNTIGGNPGDAVYSQEEFDRIVSQLMEQNSNSTAPGPAPEAAINSLPKQKVNDKMLGEDGKGECSVCMEAVSLGEEVVYLPCTHWFHNSCVSAWLRAHNTCPICRAGITSPNAGDSSSQTRRDSPPHEAWRSSNYPEGSLGNPLLVPSSPIQPMPRPSSNSRPSYGSGSSSHNQTLNANARLESRNNQHNNVLPGPASSSESGQSRPRNESEGNGGNRSHGNGTNRWLRDQYRRY